MEFETFFFYHLKLFRIIGLRLRFGGFTVPKWLTGSRHFWFCQFLTVFLLVIRICYMTMLRTSYELVLFGSCTLIYVIESFIKALEVYRNSDRIDALLEKLKIMYEAADDHDDPQLMKYFRVFMVYIKCLLWSAIFLATLPIISALIVFLITGKVFIKHQGSIWMPFRSLTMNVVMYIPQYFCALFQCFYPILDSFMMMVPIHLIFQLRKISVDLEKLREYQPKKGFFKQLIDRHTEVLRFVRRLKELFFI